MIIPISIATNGDMNTTGISPLAIACDGYLNVIRVRTLVVGGKQKPKAPASDDDEVLSILERIFGDLA